MALGNNEIRLQNVRLAFPKIWTPEPFEGGKDPTPYFSATFIIPKNHPQTKQIEDLMKTLAIAKWGPQKGPLVLKSAKAIGKVFFRDGDSKAEYEGFEGSNFISARSKTRPNTFDGMRNTVTEADGVIYAGCYVNAIISCYAYTKGNNGLGAGLKGIQYKGTGDAFSGGGKASDAEDFDELGVPSDEESGDDPLAA